MGEIYLEQLVFLLSQHGSTFNWTGTNSCVLRRFCHANTLGQLRFRRFGGEGVVSLFAPSWASFESLHQSGYHWTAKKRHLGTTWEEAEEKRQPEWRPREEQEGTCSCCQTLSQLPAKPISCSLWTNCYLSYADEATQVRALHMEVRWLWLLKISCRFSDTKAFVLSTPLWRKARKERRVHWESVSGTS